MASLNANSEDVDDTKNPYAPELELKTEVQGAGEIYGGSSAELTEKERQDKEMAERWKDEADTVLVFAGLFSAVCAVSLVESYKWLSPGSGDETVQLLNVTVNLITQVSQQLVNASRGIPLESITAESSGQFKRTVSGVMVNVIWFASMVICVACGVFATLIQQWVRQYLALTQGHGTPYERARMRNFLFNGLRRFQVDRVCQQLGFFLHISIALYSLGIAVFVYHIDRNLVFLTIGFFISLRYRIHNLVGFTNLLPGLPILHSLHSVELIPPSHVWDFFDYSTYREPTTCLIDDATVPATREREQVRRWMAGSPRKAG